MKILVMVITHNCAEVLPFFLRHYGMFADKIVAWDDGSDDGTRAMLEAHPLVSARNWVKEPGINEDVFLKHWQEEYPKARGEFDWVMVPDPDEFLMVGQGIVDAGYRMHMVLRSAHAVGYQVIQSRGFNLTGDHFPKDDGHSQIYELNPMGVRAPVYSKPIVFRPEIEIHWMRGKHQLENCAPRVSPPLLKLLHARYFGADYTRTRNAKNYERLGLLNGDKGPGWSVRADYDGEQLEGSPKWAAWAQTQAFNVLEAAL